MATEKVPDFINIGAQKCATTWLYHCLREHPEVFLEKKNQIGYFEADCYQAHDWQWYVSHFAGARNGQVIGEARVEYIYMPETPGLIARHLPRCKLILILRDPVERAVSAYLWNIRQNFLPNLSLDEGLRIAFSGDYRGYSQPQADLFDRIVRMGFYDEQIQRYLGHFGLGQFLILLKEDIKAAPLDCIRSVYGFLGVDPEFVPTALGNRPLKSAGLPILTALERRTRFVYGTGKIWEWVNQAVNQLGMGRATPKLAPQLRARLREFYAPHNQRLARTLAEYRRQTSNPPLPGFERADWLGNSTEA